MFEKVLAAKKRLEGHANKTPVMTSRTFDEMLGAEFFFKCENFQRIGAFKFRGAFNAMSQLTEEQRKRGVITYSSGNHAQAVALVGKLLGISTTIVMPNNAPEIKLAATEGYGATIIKYDVEETSREKLATELKEKHGYTVVPPYDDEEVVSGQGTAALELFEEVGPLDMLLVPCGGGGLSQRIGHSRQGDATVLQGRRRGTGTR